LSDGRDASERIVGYYSYLFTFPSRTAMVAVITTISTLGGTLFLAIGWEIADIIRGLQYGIFGLALPLLLSDFLVLPMFRGEALMNPRRFTILTYVSSIIYTVVGLLSSVISAISGCPDFILRGIMLAVAVNASFRHLCIQVFIVDGYLRNLISVFVQPSLCFATASILLPYEGTRILSLGFLAVVIMVGGVELLLFILRRWDSSHAGLKLIPLFRDFVLAWAEEMSDPLEEQISRVGEVRDLEVDSLVFDDGAGNCKATLIVPYIHPGPFRNVGSSGLPKVLADSIGEKLGCETLVAHGISTHERDITKSDDNEVVAEAVLSKISHSSVSTFASPLVWAESYGAQASCQLFWDVALITLSLSPKNYDDLPDELAERIINTAMGMGLTAVVVDSHHSLTFDSELDEYDVDTIYQAATEALRRSRKISQSGYAVGAARVIPIEWGLDEGMGPCGIAALAVRVESGQTSAYIVVDGNNMLIGLREKIIEAVRARDVDEVEVMTSDTHLVNAIGATNRGYFPIGEKTDEQKFIDYTVEAVEKAVSRLQSCNAHHARTVIHGVTVLGSRGLNALSQALESGFALFKKAGSIIALIAFLQAVAIIYLL
jgi:putative membrane protein